VVFVQAEELPKGALVEFQVNFHTGRPGLGGDADDDEMEGVYSSGSTSRGGMSWEVSAASVDGQGSRAMVCLYGTLHLCFHTRTDLLMFRLG
jgi:diphthine-ammonia ligase